MQKIKLQKICCGVLIAGICMTLLWGAVHKKNVSKDPYDDGIEQIDLNSIYLADVYFRGTIQCNSGDCNSAYPDSGGDACIK